MSALPQEINLDYDCTGLTVLHPDLFNTNADDIRESTWQKAILHWHWDLTLTWLATWSQLKLHYELYKWHLALLSPHLTRGPQQWNTVKCGDPLLTLYNAISDKILTDKTAEKSDLLPKKFVCRNILSAEILTVYGGMRNQWRILSQNW